MNTIFVLASGRSGTKFLSDLFKKNVKNCVSKHEPLPDMFGKPIYWYHTGNIDQIRRRFQKKVRRIQRYDTDFYVETNHSFLKSFQDVSMETFPDMKVIHLIRSPLKVARSELNRHQWLDSIHFPFRYTSVEDGSRFFRWALTGDEPIFHDISLESLTPYQYYVVQWVEIENRAMKFLDKYKKNSDCCTIAVPKDINDISVIQNMFNFLGLKLRYKQIVLEGKRNRNPKKTVITPTEEQQFQQVISSLPEKYLTIFSKPPYAQQSWSGLLSKSK